MSVAAMAALLGDFGAMVGISDLAPDADHRCNLMFDDVALSVELGDDDESLYIYSLLGSVADADRATTHAALLSANYGFQGTAGATLCVEPRTGGVVLVRADRLDALPLARFAAVVEDFVNTAELWTARLRDGEFAAPDADAEPEQPARGSGMVRV